MFFLGLGSGGKGPTPLFCDTIPCHLLSQCVSQNMCLSYQLQIDVVALLYYRREENEVKQLDTEATLSELMSEYGIAPDK